MRKRLASLSDRFALSGRMLGEVDRVDDHFIATQFVGLLVPVRSVYVLGHSSTTDRHLTTRRWEVVPLRLDAKSIAVAYPRVWLPLLALAWPFLTHWGERLGRLPGSVWLTSMGMVLGALLFRLPGRLGEREKRRLRVLGKITGLKLDPSKLPRATRESKRAVLADTMKAMGLPLTPEEITKAAGEAPPTARPLLYSFARYSGDDGDWRRAAAAVLARMESSP